MKENLNQLTEIYSKKPIKASQGYNQSIKHLPRESSQMEQPIRDNSPNDEVMVSLPELRPTIQHSPSPDSYALKNRHGSSLVKNNYYTNKALNKKVFAKNYNSKLQQPSRNDGVGSPSPAGTKSLQYPSGTYDKRALNRNQSNDNMLPDLDKDPDPKFDNNSPKKLNYSPNKF